MGFRIHLYIFYFLKRKRKISLQILTFSVFYCFVFRLWVWKRTERKIFKMPFSSNHLQMFSFVKWNFILKKKVKKILVFLSFRWWILYSCKLPFKVTEYLLDKNERKIEMKMKILRDEKRALKIVTIRSIFFRYLLFVNSIISLCFFHLFVFFPLLFYLLYFYIYLLRFFLRSFTLYLVSSTREFSMQQLEIFNFKTTSSRRHIFNCQMTNDE